jgi:hypothetical protein
VLKTATIRTYNNHFDKNPFISHLYGIDASGAIVAQDQYAKNVTAGYIFTGAKKTVLLVTDCHRFLFRGWLVRARFYLSKQQFYIN